MFFNLSVIIKSVINFKHFKKNTSKQTLSPSPSRSAFSLPLAAPKDENIGIDGNIEGKKYGNIGGNIGEISISIKP